MNTICVKPWEHLTVVLLFVPSKNLVGSNLPNFNFQESKGNNLKERPQTLYPILIQGENFESPSEKQQQKNTGRIYSKEYSRLQTHYICSHLG